MWNAITACSIWGTIKLNDKLIKHHSAGRTNRISNLSMVKMRTMDWKEIQSVNPKENHPWIFIGGIDAKAEAPMLWPPYVKSWLIGKDSRWERLKAGGERRMSWLDGITDSTNISLSKLWETVEDRGEDRGAWCVAAVRRVTKSQTWLCDWTTTKISIWHDLN